MEYIVSSGGISSGIIFENDSMAALGGGIAIDTTVNSRGILYVSSGGIADNTTVVSNGSKYVRSGDSVTVNTGCYFCVSKGGTVSHAMLNFGGKLYVSDGAVATGVMENGG